MHKPLRLALFLLALLGLLLGLLSGLARLGVEMPAFAARQLGHHGVFMISGMFGTLISLERAVAMAKPWPWLAPGCAGIASLLLLTDAGTAAAQWLYCAAALILSLASLKLWRQQPVLHLAVLALGAGMWLFANLIWATTGSTAAAVPAWQAFLVLTIAGERLELSRFLPTPASARRVFAVLAAALACAAVLAPLSMWLAHVLAAISLIGLSIWLLRHDIVRRTLRQQGLPRYIAVCLGSGYLWLLVSAALMLGMALAGRADLRDAMLHTLLLGFVVSMVFGHAPIILPAVARLRLDYHPVLYLPLALLHASLLVRLVAALIDDLALRQNAAIANVLSLLLFAGLVFSLVLRARVPR